MWEWLFPETRQIVRSPLTLIPAFLRISIIEFALRRLIPGERARIGVGFRLAWSGNELLAWG